MVMASGLALGIVSMPSSTLGAESAKIQTILNQDGSGGMIVNSQTNPSDETWSWESCSVDLKTCASFAHGRSVETTGASAPSVFRAVSNRGATALSPRWDGKVESTSPPSVLGTPQANELVVPVSGEWRGGWADDVDWTQLAACEGPHDEDCTTLTDRHYIGGCSNGAAVIDPMFTGMYLRVADRRIAARTPELAYAVGSPYSPNIWPAGQTVSVAIVGRIRAEDGPPTTGCGPSPLVEASISARGVARVRCGLDCRATLVARQGKHKALVSRKLSALSKSSAKVAVPELQLTARQLKRFDPGSVRMMVKVNGKRAATRVVQLIRG